MRRIHEGGTLSAERVVRHRERCGATTWKITSVRKNILTHTQTEKCIDPSNERLDEDLSGWHSVQNYQGTRFRGWCDLSGWLFGDGVIFQAGTVFRIRC